MYHRLLKRRVIPAQNRNGQKCSFDAIQGVNIVEKEASATGGVNLGWGGVGSGAYTFAGIAQ